MENEITLTWYEIYMAAHVGVARRLASLERKETNKVQNKDFGWHSDIEGACGELAVAKFLGIFWDGSINTFKAPDVGLLHVRHTQLPNGHLFIREGDDERGLYVLVTGFHPIYKIPGFMIAINGMKDEYSKNPNGKFPTWMVPQSKLLDINLLNERKWKKD